MPGIHTFLLPIKNLDIEKSPFLSKEENPKHKLKSILQDDVASLYLTYYDGYPFLLWQAEDQIILFEGMIYNRPKNTIVDQLYNISKIFGEDGDYLQFVRAFVESADGDFIVQIWDNSKKRLLLFNNYWGRLPLYYYASSGMFGISRDIKSLLPFIPEIKFNKTSLVEFLYFEFPLGNKTLFENIYRLEPACMLVVEVREKVLEYKITQVVNITFDLKDPFASPSVGIDELKKLFLQSVQSRVQVLDGDEFQIVADLSGGFDSRAVLGGLEKFTHDVIYCTQTLNANDQRKWGQAIFKAMDSPGRFLTATPDHSYEFEELGEFVYQYDCMANYSIGFNSNQVVTTLRDLVPGKAARFMGFGGEFLRHPIKAFRKSLIYGIDHGNYFYSNSSLSDVCHLLNTSYLDYHRELEGYLNTYPEQTSEGQLRRLYFEYFNHYVNASEDYCCKYFWTVSPFWGSMLMQAIMERLPLEWTGYKYFNSIMKAVDPRLLHTPIFGKNVKLNSEWSVTLLETKERLKTWVTAFVPNAHYFYKNMQERMNGNNKWNKIDLVIRGTTNPLVQSTLSQSQLRFLAGNVLISRRYLTLQLYLSEIERRFHIKFFNNSLNEMS